MGEKMVKGIYHCNEGTFKVEILTDKCFIDLAVAIKLLEPINLRTPSGLITLPKGYILHVGNWQVKPLNQMERTKKEG